MVTENGWFAARPSGTEDIYKLYAESFNGEQHLDRIIEQAHQPHKPRAGVLTLTAAMQRKLHDRGEATT